MKGRGRETGRETGEGRGGRGRGEEVKCELGTVSSFLTVPDTNQISV